MVTVNCSSSTSLNVKEVYCCSDYYKKVLIYHPSNSKKGIAIKGTNLRVELVKKWKI